MKSTVLCSGRKCRYVMVIVTTNNWRCEWGNNYISYDGRRDDCGISKVYCKIIIYCLSPS